MNTISQAVLFADIGNSTELYDTLGDEVAHALVGRGLERLAQAAQNNGGRVVRHLGDEIMASFDDADAALSAAFAMQWALSTPEFRALSGLRVGVHFGAVLEGGDDVHGDVVNIASRAVKLARLGGVILTKAAVEALSRKRDYTLTAVGSIQVRGKREPLEFFEAGLDDGSDVLGRTSFANTGRFDLGDLGATLTLLHPGGVILVDAERDRISMGRNADNDLIINDQWTSRRHAEVFLRNGRFYLVDCSSNGTYVERRGEADSVQTIRLLREEILLTGRGSIHLGWDPAKCTGRCGIDFEVV